VIQPQSSRAAAAAADGLASWYTPGLVDGFGDRLLMFDNTETDSLELLRFYPSLTAIDGFEDDLHERVRQVGRIPDHAFPLIVAVDRLDGDGALALVSTHVPGKRLSAFFEKPGPRRGLTPGFVTGIVTQIIQALTVLQSKGDDITHSAITPDRIVVTTSGRICVVEHVLGSALRRLNLSQSQLWREFGLVSAPTATGAIRLDARTDVFQLGVVTLEMLLGRRLTPLDLKDRLPDLLDQWTDAVTRAGLASDRLRYWLERALQLRTSSYGTAADAYADLREVPSESAASAFDQLIGEFETPLKRSLQPAKQAAGQVAPMQNAPAPQDLSVVSVPPPVRPALVAPENRRADLPPAPPPPAKPVAPSQPAARGGTGVAKRLTTFKAPRVSPWIAAALAAIALLEGGVITALLMRQPAQAVTAAAPAPVTPAPPTEPPPADPPVILAAAAAPVVPAAAPPPQDAADPIRAAASNQRSGGVRIAAPVELKVLQGDRVLGSSADGPIVATAGTYQLELINSALGVNMRRQVTFLAGQITRIDVTIPPGRVSINAQPWAEVSIDNRPVGETPLANLSVPVGEHDVVFRHPELGERRQRITVRADTPARVSQSFEK
jgi:eukaryotic-like serine/threonine-protein kinase